MEDLHEAIGLLTRGLDVRHRENVEHMDSNTQQLKEITEQIKQLREGFPDSDPDGHRRYHEELIRAAEEKRKFWIDWRLHMMRTGSWAALAFVVYQFADYVKWIIGKIPGR